MLSILSRAIALLPSQKWSSFTKLLGNSFKGTLPATKQGFLPWFGTVLNENKWSIVFSALISLGLDDITELLESDEDVMNLPALAARSRIMLAKSINDTAVRVTGDGETGYLDMSPDEYASQTALIRAAEDKITEAVRVLGGRYADLKALKDALLLDSVVWDNYDPSRRGS